MTRAYPCHWIAGAALLLVSATAQAITLDFVPSSFSVFTEEQLAVDVRIGGLTDAGAPSLSSFDLDVHFEPTVLMFAALTLGIQCWAINWISPGWAVLKACVPATAWCTCSSSRWIRRRN